MKYIVVLAGTTPWSVLIICKQAKKQGVHTLVVCSDEKYKEKLASNKYVDEAQVCLNHELVDFLMNHQGFPAREDIMLIPTTDVLCQILSEDYHKLNSRFLIGMTSPEMVDAFTDKQKAHVAAQAAGLLCPQSVILDVDNYDESLLSAMPFPVIVKPLGAASHKALGFKFRVFFQENELKDFIKSFPGSRAHLICQEYIPGEDASCLFYVFYRKEDGTVYSCQGEKTLQSNGIMTIGTTKDDARLSDISEKFLSAVGYCGLGGIEYKVYDGKYYFIEMSTRSEGFLPVADMCGVPATDALIADLTGCWPSVSKQVNDVRYIAGLGWVMHRLKTKKIGKLICELFSFLFSSKSHFVEHYVGWKY